MKNKIKSLIFTVVATCYYPVSEQTDSTPDITADGSRINMECPLSHRWIAISRDLENYFSMGDTVNVCGTGVYDGKWVIKDRMNKRWKRKIDFLVGENDYVDKFKNVVIWK